MMSLTSFTKSQSIGSLIDSMFFFTLSELVVLNSVVGILSLLTENCMASFSIGKFLVLQYSAALAQASTNGFGAGCQSGTPLSVSNPIDSGDALMIPTPFSSK